MSAAPLLSDNFESYATGDLNGNGGWTANAAVDVVAGGLDYANGDITINGGDQRVFSNALSPNAQTALASNSFASQDGEVWFSFTLQADNSSNTPRYWFYVGEDAALASGSSGVKGSIADNNTGDDGIRAEFRRNTNAQSSSDAAFTSNEVLFVVGRLSKDGVGPSAADAYDLFEFWLNPSSTTLGAPTRSIEPNTASTFTDGIDTFGLTTLSAATDLSWDNLLIGTSQADVVDVYTTPIPEPASLALVGLGLLAIGGRRRRA
ncbi:MAG: PEP-CTERM sorting domain-containing protein [Planctomycetota bacterium]